MALLEPCQSERSRRLKYKWVVLLGDKLSLRWFVKTHKCFCHSERSEESFRINSVVLLVPF